MGFTSFVNHLAQRINDSAWCCCSVKSTKGNQSGGQLSTTDNAVAGGRGESVVPVVAEDDGVDEEEGEGDVVVEVGDEDDEFNDLARDSSMICSSVPLVTDEADPDNDEDNEVPSTCELAAKSLACEASSKARSWL